MLVTWHFDRISQQQQLQHWLQLMHRFASSSIRAWRRCGLRSLVGAAGTELVSLRSFGSRLYSADPVPHQDQETGHICQHARVLDGRAVAAQWQEELAREVTTMRSRGLRRPGLGVVLVGGRPDSALYVARKQEACSRVGIYSELCHLPANSSQQEVQDAVTALCRNPAIDGVLVQLPLPRHVDEEAIIESFDPSKDVDGFHPLNIGRILMRGRSAHFVPCTALGCIQLLERSGVPIRDKSVVVMGDSNIVGMPLAMLFRDAGAATVTVVHRTSYRELFQDTVSSEQRALQRAQAEACLPRLPGLLSRHTPSTKDEQQQQQQQAPTAAARQHPPHRPYKVTYAGQMRQEVYLGNNSDSEDVRRLRPPSAHAQQQQQQQQAEQPQQQQLVEQQGEASTGAKSMHLEDLPGITRTADILVVAVGYPQLVRASWVKQGAVVIDVGINVVDGGWGGEEGAGQRRADGTQEQHHDPCQPQLEGRHRDHQSQQQQQQGGAGQAGPPPVGGFHVVGDVDFCDVSEVASAVTPVPGGVGPMTISALMHNTVLAAKYRLGLESAG